MNDEPTVEVSNSAKEIEVYVQKLGTFRIKMEEGVESKFMGNGFPHLILAHLLCTGVSGEGENPHNLRLHLIGELADKKYIVRKADSTFFHEGIPTFELGRVGEVMLTNIGIVEPITQALHLNLLWLPKLFESFFNNALEEKKYRLLHRMYIAAKNAKAMQMTDNISAAVCNRIIKSYEALLPEVMAVALTADSAGREEEKRIENRIRALKKRKTGPATTPKKPKRKKRKR
ncbi:hypothetical protein LJ707_10315 [Mucilaginibacter sp. UR6-1]|uniref:hypothetical protein n=1 Tax=Mucilaginibacter sp. UR6-1 TaxID=1435643 RepID=UPI001E3115B5|nr:hypothetical protein [Mucilaginibacter sp. UR6-1]MCC8409327.1 hypothetical protein [Mucilaginibacter sp. UR6-1]